MIRLERRVEKRTAELREANEQLQRRVRKRRRVEATLNAFFSAFYRNSKSFDDQFRYIKSDSSEQPISDLDAQSMSVGHPKDNLAPHYIEEFGPMIRECHRNRPAGPQCRSEKPRAGSSRGNRLLAGLVYFQLLCPGQTRIRCCRH